MTGETLRKIIAVAIVISSIAIVLMLSRCSAIERKNKIEIINNDIQADKKKHNEIDTTAGNIYSFETVDIKDGETKAVSYEITGYENGKKYIKINCLLEENNRADLKAYQDGIELLRSEQRLENINEKMEMSFKFELRNTEDKIDLVFEELDRKTLKVIEKNKISFDIKDKNNK